MTPTRVRLLVLVVAVAVAGCGTNPSSQAAASDAGVVPGTGYDANGPPERDAVPSTATLPAARLEAL